MDSDSSTTRFVQVPRRIAIGAVVADGYKGKGPKVHRVHNKYIDLPRLEQVGVFLVFVSPGIEQRALGELVRSAFTISAAKRNKNLGVGAC